MYVFKLGNKGLPLAIHRIVNKKLLKLYNHYHKFPF